MATDDTRNDRVDLLMQVTNLARLTDVQRRVLVMIIRTQGGIIRIPESVFEDVEPSADMDMQVDRQTREVVLTEKRRK